MEQLIQRCAGIDVGLPDAVTGAPAELIANYGTTTPVALYLNTPYASRRPLPRALPALSCLAVCHALAVLPCLGCLPCSVLPCCHALLSTSC